MAPSLDTPSPFVRVFLAIEIDDALRKGLVEAQNRLRKTCADVAWVRPENLHLSLHFLGDIVEDKTVVLAEMTDRVLEGHAPFDLGVQGLSYFGNSRAPRVVWAGTRPSPDLSAVHAGITGGLAALGIPVETREFHPHVTLGRVRSRQGCDDLLQAIEAQSEQDFGQIHVDSVVLFRSRLLPQGTEYVPLHRSSLSPT